MQTETLQSIASDLLNARVISIDPLGGGRNSRVYRVVDRAGQAYALKIYFRHAADPRDRLATEFGGLQFLWAHGTRGIPQPLAADRAAGCALYEYIAGQPIASSDVCSSDIDAAVEFLGCLKTLSQKPESRQLPFASEACFSLAALAENLRGRLDRLLQPKSDEPIDAALHGFLTEQFMPTLQTIIGWSASRCSFHVELPWPERTLSPSDFGFHNARRGPDGRPVFLDFEYFGWDDPAKTLSDFLLHPAMELSEDLQRQFARALLPRLGHERSLVERTQCVYPLFGLKWCLILLNEFLPEHLLRRRFAATADKPGAAAQAEQLAKARRMFARICREYEHFPYFV